MGTAAITASAALAQNAPPPAPVPASQPTDEIVVTGTSIRGVAPVGSNLVSVTAETLAATGEQTVTGALDSVPSLSGVTGQGTTSAFYQPSIHQLGASASNSTLVLIDGHRGPTGGTNHTFLDPNIVPDIMIQRVEVLAEGASSVYGSDAVAGVINFITRRKFDGIRADVSTTLRDGTTGYSAGLLMGTTGDTFSAVVGAGYIYQDNLRNKDRDFTYPDHRNVSLGNGRTGGNFLTSFCDPASINSTALTCTNWDVTDLLGKETRQNVMARISFTPTSALEMGVDLLYSRRRGVSRNGAGTIQATVFSGGQQANPFYTGPGASQTVRWDATSLFGPAKGHNNSDSMYANFTLGYDFTSDWHLDFLASAGRDESSTFTTGAINSSVALLGLNGTTNGGGSLTAISIPGTTTIITQLPLTTANALDVWNPASSNRTSQAVRDALMDNTNLLRNTTGYQQVRASVTGSLFELPAGAVKLAVGGEMYNTQLSQFVSRANNSGPARQGSQQLKYDFSRKVYSGFAELNVPVISPEMGVSFISKLDLSASVRYDHYSEFGGTTNPKFAFNLDPIEGLRLRGNYSTSFVSPPLTIFGDQYGSFGTAGWSTQTNNVNIPVSAYPAVAQIIPSCAGQALCNIATLQGIQVTSGDQNAGPQEGSGWSLGVDLGPQLVPGLHAGITYWSTKFDGGTTGPQLQNVINTASAQFLLSFYPGCATQADIAAVTQGIPQTNSQAACTNYIFRTINSNWLNLRVAGIDYNIDYDLRTESAGTFSAGISGTQFTRYRQSFGDGPFYDILGTAGINGTFPSNRTKLRGYLGWSDGTLAIRAFANYTGSYRNWSSSTVTPLTRDENGNPSGGGDKVKSQTTFDLNISYDLPGVLNGARIAVASRNLFDKDPPYYNGASGYYSLINNPYGRTVTLNLSIKL
ncbi:TonB-dependent receptor domain-containing protein [Sphingomonas quercus]|uniref:TonB-dependent receptor domain-containing protein n=1 Tax=Sphingomonas quercus TaxID=2842451 RepID=UPI001C0E74CA|nr:TonB-dependent receptor [Sphingomonas quercus]